MLEKIKNKYFSLSDTYQIVVLYISLLLGLSGFVAILINYTMIAYVIIQLLLIFFLAKLLHLAIKMRRNG